MEKHECRTYFSLNFDFDIKKNAGLFKKRRDCEPEEIGILNKKEAEGAVIKAFGIIPEWKRHRFVLGFNENYNVDVNEMLRVTLKDLFGKEEQIKKLKKEFSLSAILEIVPVIASNSNEPNQYLSLERDIIEFLYKSETDIDLDYYVV
mgnify:CR=1 FL=1